MRPILKDTYIDFNIELFNESNKQNVETSLDLKIHQCTKHFDSSFECDCLSILSLNRNKLEKQQLSYVKLDHRYKFALSYHTFANYVTSLHRNLQIMQMF